MVLEGTETSLPAGGTVSLLWNPIEPMIATSIEAEWDHPRAGLSGVITVMGYHCWEGRLGTLLPKTNATRMHLTREIRRGLPGISWYEAGKLVDPGGLDLRALKMPVVVPGIGLRLEIRSANRRPVKMRLRLHGVDAADAYALRMAKYEQPQLKET